MKATKKLKFEELNVNELNELGLSQLQEINGAAFPTIDPETGEITGDIKGF